MAASAWSKRSAGDGPSSSGSGSSALSSRSVSYGRADEPDTVIEHGARDCWRGAAGVDHVDVVSAEFERELGPERQHRLPSTRVGVLPECDSDVDVAVLVWLVSGERTEAAPDRDGVSGEYGANRPAKRVEHSLVDRFERPLERRYPRSSDDYLGR